MKLWPFTAAKAAPTPSDAARALSQHRIATERERIHAKARQLCIEAGRPVPEAIQ
jgi:hypothetical protein